MIESFILKDIATFDSSGITVNNLKKVNFIYGSNGCGKTTITKFLYKPNEQQFQNCSLLWKSQIPIMTLVYNKDFRERNFGKGVIEGVFTLGEATKEALESISKMQKNLSVIKDNGIKKKEALDKLLTERQEFESEFKETVWVNIYKEYENSFKEAFIGVMKKDYFRSKLLEEYQKNTSTVLTYEGLKEQADTIFGNIPKTISSITKINFERIVEIERNEIWKMKIIGKSDVDLAKVIQKLNINDWVNEGREYLQNDKTCPFCQQQTITQEFKNQLEDYFDESFTNSTKKIKTLADEYNRFSLNLVNYLSHVESVEKLNTHSKLNIDIYSTYIKTLTSQFISNKELLSNKIKEPSRSIDLVSVSEQLENIEKLINDTNALILKHNLIVENYDKEKASLIKNIWRFLCDKYKPIIETYLKKYNGLQKGIDGLQEQHKSLQNEYLNLNKKIKDANKGVTSVQPSVDEINKTLKSFGFSNFEIVPSKNQKNHYEINREDGSKAELTLSEGEITFITFLYFLQLSKGSNSEETINEERILIIDDPISSLDSSVLFVVSTLLKELIKKVKAGEGNIKQLILLTHNVYFHKEVSFIDGRTAEHKETFFWILRKRHNISFIQCYEMKNPINNSYELLWLELKNRSKLSGITIQNTMRRIIENYFKILGKYGDDELIKKFDDHQEQAICRSLICWINDGSHSMPDDLFIEQLDASIEKYFDVFRKIFDRTGHPEHFNMMIGEN